MRTFNQRNEWLLLNISRGCGVFRLSAVLTALVDWKRQPAHLRLKVPIQGFDLALSRVASNTAIAVFWLHRFDLVLPFFLQDFWLGRDYVLFVVEAIFQGFQR